MKTRKALHLFTHCGPSEESREARNVMGNKVTAKHDENRKNNRTLCGNRSRHGTISSSRVKIAQVQNHVRNLKLILNNLFREIAKGNH